MGHFGVKKTEDILAFHFFWPKMRRDVECYVFLLVFTICLQGHSLLGEANLCVHGLVTNRAVV
jgi:hypothetical protein